MRAETGTLLTDGVVTAAGERERGGRVELRRTDGGGATFVLVMEDAL